MDTSRRNRDSEIVQNMMRPHEWEQVATFMLSLAKGMPRLDACMLKPVVDSLSPYGLADAVLCQISQEIERAGEELRNNCPEGKLDCINVRININTHALRGVDSALRAWRFFVIKQIASSESDNLEVMEHPSCYIDVQVY